MKKNELRYFLSIYYLLTDAVRNKKTETKIQLYGRIKSIDIPVWLYKTEDVFLKIIKEEKSLIIEEIIEQVYRRGEDDKWVMLKLPISESGYYRLKRKIEDKIYELYIAYGYVTEEEIMSNKIAEQAKTIKSNQLYKKEQKNAKGNRRKN